MGKSALLKIAHAEDTEKNILSLWLRPDDVRAVIPSIGSGNLNARIVAWKGALTHLIARKIIDSYGEGLVENVDFKTRFGSFGDIVNVTKEIFSKKINQKIDLAKHSIMLNFMKNNLIRIYLDDLDRGWEAKQSDIQNISAMLNAIRDLCGDKSLLQFRLGLRSDVYFLVRTSDESTDKIE